MGNLYGFRRWLVAKLDEFIAWCRYDYWDDMQKQKLRAYGIVEMPWWYQRMQEELEALERDGKYEELAMYENLAQEIRDARADKLGKKHPQYTRHFTTYNGVNMHMTEAEYEAYLKTLAGNLNDYMQYKSPNWQAMIDAADAANPLDDELRAILDDEETKHDGTGKD